MTVTPWPDSFAGRPGLIPVIVTVCSPASSRMAAGSVMSSSVGASLTGVTVTSNESVTNSPASSVARMTSVATPFWFASGVMVSTDPARVTDTTPGAEFESTENTRLAVAVSASLK